MPRCAWYPTKRSTCVVVKKIAMLETHSAELYELQNYQKSYVHNVDCTKIFGPATQSILEELFFLLEESQSGIES